MSRKLLFCFGAASLAAAALLAAVWRGKAVQQIAFSRSFPVMGTIASVQFFSSPEQSEKALAAVRTEFGRVMQIANLYDPASELSRLNRTAFQQPFGCSELLWKLLDFSRRAYAFSDGAFDVSAKPLMVLWGFYRKNKPGNLPGSLEIAAARSRVGLDKVKFNDAERTVRFTVPGMALDLGGIAKGFALDLAAERVRQIGITSGVIDLGGNLLILGPPPGKTHCVIGIRDPHQSGKLSSQQLQLDRGAVATSGDYERFVEIQGKRYGHIMDPATGMPVHRDFSVTVTAPEAVTADFLSTTFYLRPELKKRLPGTRPIFTR